MRIKILPCLMIILVTSCGDNSPFDEDYWDDPSSTTRESDQNEQERTYNVEITSLVEGASTVSGTSTITVNETDVVTSLSLTEVPQSVMIAQKSITNLSCAQVISTNPNPPIPNNTGEFKDINLTDSGSREALIAELNQADPRNGDSVNLEGRTFVVRAYVSNLNTPAPETTALFPVACGTIVVSDTSEDDTTGSTNGGTTTGGSVTGGTVTGGTTGTTIGGVAGTVDGGTVGGTVTGGATGTTVGGVDGTVAGGVGGGVGGSIGSTAGGTTF